MPTDWKQHQLSAADVKSQANGRVFDNVLIKGYRNYETGETNIDTSQFSKFIKCFECGADTQTQIAMLSSIQGNMSAVPDTEKLVSAVDEMFPKINSKLNARFDEFTTKRTIYSDEYDEIRWARAREPSTSQPLDQDVFLSKLCRTGAFPIDSEETFLIVAACAHIVLSFRDLEFAYQCVEALFIHNNRRYEQTAQRQHRHHEGMHQKSGHFTDTRGAACRRYKNWDFGCNGGDDDASATTVKDYDDSSDDTDDSVYTSSPDGCDHTILDEVPVNTSKSAPVTGEDSFKQISSDRVMLWGAFHFMMIIADAGALMLHQNPMEIIEQLHAARPLYVITTTAYTEALQRAESHSPQEIVKVYHRHGECSEQRKEMCHREFREWFARKAESKISIEWIEAELEKEIAAVSKTTPHHIPMSLEEFTNRLDASRRSASTRRIVKLLCLCGDVRQQDLCREAFFTFHKAQHQYSAEWIDECFEANLLKNSCPSKLFTPYSDRLEKDLQHSIDKWAYTDRLAGHLPQLIAGITADETYNERFVRGLPLDIPVMAVKSACGTGKSRACQELIKSIPDNVAIIVVSHRKALSLELCRRYSHGRIAYLYSDIIATEGSIDLKKYSFVVCQYESLSKVLAFDNPYVVIIDEVNSVLNQMTSTYGDSHASHRRFMNLMKRADKVLVMDGFLDDDRLNLINQYTPTKAYVIHNTYQPLGSHQFLFTGDKQQALKHLGLLLKQGKNVICPCTLKKDAELVHQYALSESILEEDEIQIYTRDKRWPNGQDVNDVWARARLVIFTSTMDSGHDFNIVHFTHCVGFLSNIVDIPYETGLQMMARSRPTTNFLLCVPQTAASRTKSFVIAEILEEQRQKEASLVNLHNNLHFGNMGMEDITNRCVSCPFLHILATNEMLIRKTRSSQFLPLIKELLLRDGADPDNMAELGLMLCDEDLKAMDRAKKTAKANAPAPSIATLQRNYNIKSYDIFAKMDDDTRKIYGNRTLIHAFQNQSALRVEGVDTESAITNIETKILRTCKVLDECSKSGNFCENSIAQTRKFLVDGAASLVDSNETALKLFSVFTGSADPFSFGSILGSDLRRNLGCADVADPKSLVSQRIRDQIACMYEKWSDICWRHNSI